TSSPLLPGDRRSAVVSWWPRPAAASRAASSALGGVARNSLSATTSGAQPRSCRAMASTRAPPPARMFQATIRTGSARLEGDGAEAGAARRMRVVGVALEAHPLDGARRLAELAAEVGVDVAPLAPPAAGLGRARTHDDE